MKMVNSKQKGKRGELEFCHYCMDRGYENIERSQQYCGIKGDADVVGIDGLHIEVKRVQKLNIDKAMNQSISDAKEDEMPIVAHRKDRDYWKVTMKAEDFLKIYKVYLNNK